MSEWLCNCGTLTCKLDSWIHALHLEWIAGTGLICDAHDAQIFKDFNEIDTYQGEKNV